MSFYYSPAEMLASAQAATSRRYASLSRETATAALRESLSTASPEMSSRFDIFLSYKWDDVLVATGVYRDLTRRGYSVYIDHVMDPQLNRATVTDETVEVLRNRLMQSKSLFYAVTDHSASSTWMPWELGFEDGYRGKAAIVPITDNFDFKGVEFISVYPRVVPFDSFIAVYSSKREYISTFEAWRDSIPKRGCGMPKCPLPQ